MLPLDHENENLVVERAQPRKKQGEGFLVTTQGILIKEADQPVGVGKNAFYGLGQQGIVFSGIDDASSTVICVSEGNMISGVKT